MSRKPVQLSLFAVSLLLSTSIARTQPLSGQPDLTKQPTLFVVGYAHLDTQWRWEYPQVIREYIPNTMHDNFKLFAKYPHYIFNFSGSNRYHFMKEYYPADYVKVKEYVAKGRWFPAGSSVEESDVNSPSAESIFRQILYGNEFFRHEFDTASAGYMLPDCFGFPASLPSILAHAGLKGFSTQKLTWGSFVDGGPGSPEDTPVGIPFNVGLWIGPDGHSIIAALNPGSYDGDITTDLSKTWAPRIERDGKVSGVYADYHYYGTGDIGGAPREPSVKLLEAIITHSEAILPPPNWEPRPWGPAPPPGTPVLVGDGPVQVISSKADQIYLDIKPFEEKGLPRYQGDLELTNHSAGSLTSEAYQKRWNRKNEILADAAEKASVAAQWLGGRTYPLDRLNEAWRLVMGGQFHDIMAGTATPKAYEYSWNDDVLAMNQFAQVLTSATDAIASALNTNTAGTPLIVYNPLSIARQDVVEASIHFPDGAPKAVHVYDPDGNEVPSQIDGEQNGATKILFLADLPPVGYTVFDVQTAATRASRVRRVEKVARIRKASVLSPAASDLTVTQSTLENAHYRVRIDENGDVASIFDKGLNKELLSAPARLAFQYEKPSQWPAWNMDWEDQSKPPRAYVHGPASVRIVENGPVRVALEIRREGEGSRFAQTIRLSAGDAGKRIEFANVIDWKTGESALKAVFPLSASNPEATYNWGVGTVKRSNDSPKQFEYPSHQWFDLTDASGSYGVTVLSDCKYGSDKPSDNMLRLTLLYTPGISERAQEYADQSTQDWGHHEFLYGLSGHAGDWRQAETDWQALRLNDPLIVFDSAKHRGILGGRFSLLKVSDSRVRVMALKKAEANDEFIVRLVEADGKPQTNVHLKFAAPVMAAREVDGQERALGPANVSQGEIVLNFTPYQLHTLALKLSPPANPLAPFPFGGILPLPYNRAVATTTGSKSSPGFDAAGEAIAAEMLPPTLNIPYAGAAFQLTASNGPDAVVAEGQTIKLPPGDFNRVYILAASAAGDQKATFLLGNRPVDLDIEDWGGYIGQWDNRTWNIKDVHPEPQGLPEGIQPGTPEAQRFLDWVHHQTYKQWEYTGEVPGFIKRAPVAWFASHRHTASGENEPYSYSYLFAYQIDNPEGAPTLTLPKNDKIRIMAITVSTEKGNVHPAWPLYDTLQRIQQ